MPTESDFFRFVYQRHLIWYKRFVLRQSAPWTDDLILATFKIINMYRELDTCTIYLVEKLKGVSDRTTVLVNVVFYRFFNLCNLYEDLGIDVLSTFDARVRDLLIERFDSLKKSGRPIFNNAYLISSGGRGSKHVNVLSYLSIVNWSRLVTDLDQSTTPEESFDYLMNIPMVGPFLACEMWTDLTYVKWFKQGWTDNDFVNIGPGAKWGLELLYGKMNPAGLEKKLRGLYEKQWQVLPTIHEELGEELSWKEIAFRGASSNYPFLSITNVEGALCEFRKYWNISHGVGRRKYFHPRGQ